MYYDDLTTDFVVVKPVFSCSDTNYVKIYLVFYLIKLKIYDGESLKSCYSFLESSLKIEDLIDIDGDELVLSLSFLKNFYQTKRRVHMMF